MLRKWAAQVILSSSRHLCKETASSTSNNSDYLPSPKFMHRHVIRPSEKAKFVKIAAEIDIFKKIYNENKLNFDDSMWLILMNMLNYEERCTYLIEMRRSLKKQELDPELISVRNNCALSNGAMVYAKHFHTMFDIYGQDFRKKIDDMYGLRMCNRLNDPKLIIDCRFLREYSVSTQARYIRQMQQTHDKNWTSSDPLEIIFANYQPDAQLTGIAKKTLNFCYGPPSRPDENFTPHIFSPSITSRRITQLFPKEHLLYISSKATRFLPEHIPQSIKGIVYCLSNDSSPPTSSRSACLIDRVEPYRIPFKKYISAPIRPSKIQLSQIALIFRQYFNGLSIKEILHKNEHMFVRCSSENVGVKINELDEKFRSALHQVNNCSAHQSDHHQTRQKNRSLSSFAYVIISILMVVLWSMYLCIDGRRNPKKDTRVIHMLAQNAFFRSVP